MCAFCAFYAFHALTESVSYGLPEGLKVQVPPPAFFPRNPDFRGSRIRTEKSKRSQR
jgi:hypothetical protein